MVERMEEKALSWEELTPLAKEFRKVEGKAASRADADAILVGLKRMGLDPASPEWDEQHRLLLTKSLLHWKENQRGPSAEL